MSTCLKDTGKLNTLFGGAIAGVKGTRIGRDRVGGTNRGMVVMSPCGDCGNFVGTKSVRVALKVRDVRTLVYCSLAVKSCVIPFRVTKLTPMFVGLTARLCRTAQKEFSSAYATSIGEQSGDPLCHL